MHWYKRNIGDYSKKAGRLSMLQHGAYTLLLDSCYDRERFPTMEEAIDWTWASTKEEIEAVEFVLRKFFVLVDGLYVQQRIQDELIEYREKAEKNKRIAEEREQNRRKKAVERAQESTPRARTVDESCTYRHLTNNQEPITKNQEPELNNKTLSASADVILVFDHWRMRMNHTGARLDDKRKKLITKALKMGYTTQQLVEAIDGCGKSGWHMGQNPDGKIYDGLDLILRDGSKIDQFIKLNTQQPIVRTGHAQPGQPTPIDNSAAGRVRAAIERERSAQTPMSGGGAHPVADDGIDVRPQVGEFIRHGG